jgi:hypothetical protein
MSTVRHSTVLHNSVSSVVRLKNFATSSQSFLVKQVERLATARKRLRNHLVANFHGPAFTYRIQIWLELRYDTVIA